MTDLTCAWCDKAVLGWVSEGGHITLTREAVHWPSDVASHMATKDRPRDTPEVTERDFVCFPCWAARHRSQIERLRQIAASAAAARRSIMLSALQHEEDRPATVSVSRVG